MLEPDLRESEGAAGGAMLWEPGGEPVAGAAAAAADALFADAADHVLLAATCWNTLWRCAIVNGGGAALTLFR